MSQVDSLTQKQLQRLQRFINHKGFTVEMEILNTFYCQSQEKIEKKTKSQSPTKTRMQPVVWLNIF